MMNGDIKILKYKSYGIYVWWMSTCTNSSRCFASSMRFLFEIREDQSTYLREPSLVVAAWLPLVGGGPWYLVFGWLFSLIWWGVITYPRFFSYLCWNCQIKNGKNHYKNSFCNFLLGWIPGHSYCMNKDMKHSYSLPHCWGSLIWTF